MEAYAESYVSPGESVLERVDRLAHLLPAQGPIGVFVHHNTLHAFQNLPFERAVLEASQLFGTEPYRSEAAYLRDLERGRILPADIDAVVAREPNSAIVEGRCDRRNLRRTVLRRGLRPVTAESVEWAIEEGGLLDGFRRDLTVEERRRLTGGAESEAAAVEDLFQVCRLMIGAPAPAPVPEAQRPRDGFLAACKVDLDDIVHPLLIRLCSTFLDQGQAYWPMPKREVGLLAAARALLRSGGVYPEHLAGLDAEMLRQTRAGMSAEQTIEDAMAAFGVSAEDFESVLRAELLALPGWAGLIHRVEEQPDLVVHERVPARLADYLALRLSLNKVAATNLTKRFGLPPLNSGAWRVVEAEPRREGPALAAAARLMDVAQLLGMGAAELRALNIASVARLVREVDAFDENERRRLYHLAYERRHERTTVSSIVKHGRRRRLRAKRPAAQLFFCLDERSESIRRHVEEVDPEIETHGTAGFFGVAIAYTGIDDPTGMPLCPIVVKPKNAVVERFAPHHAHLRETRAARRKLWAQLAWSGYSSSRMLVRGWLSTAVLGMMSLFPLTARVLAPRSYARLRGLLNRAFLPVPQTELVYMSDDEASQALVSGMQLGFSLREKVDCVASVLGPAGFRDRFARLVIALGHGSTSLNNPLLSAYNCGACGGRRGGPNARLFAAMANRPDVRRELEKIGIVIPHDTWFIGGEHDTCTDAITLFDLHAVPASHRQDLAHVQASLDKARELNAHERSRRFEAVETLCTPAEALRHVEERSEHLGEPRPEYGHCTNALCIVGRRSLTQGLFLDRRAFLSCYDATLDPDDSYLTGALGAVIPICGGINLEYYFSCVDNERYGCGTKLPHNVTGLVGVMNGHASDLRTGLTSQMIEIHEPVRLLTIVETTPERLLRAIHRNAAVRELVENGWVRLATVDPDTSEAHIYRDGRFEPFTEDPGELPTAATSMDWYRGKMDHLPIARIERGLPKDAFPAEAEAATELRS